MAMQLDSATLTFLETMRAAGGKPLYEQTVDEVRAGIRMASQQLAAPPAEVHHVHDRHIGDTGAPFRIRVYTPRPIESDESLPIILHFHGGGFVAGDVDTHDSIARYCSSAVDAVVIGVDYRLAPEHRFPAAVDDAYAAVRWAVEHAREIQGDPRRIAVTGDSAGGNLSAVVCQLAKERRGPSIAYQALVYPAVDFDLSRSYPSREQFGGGEYFLSNRDMEWFRDLYLANPQRQASDPRVSPLAHGDLTGLPPALVMTSGCDPLRDEGQAYADRLRAAGVPVEYHCVPGTIHACMSFAGAIPAGLQALAFVAGRLRTALHAAAAV